MGIYVERISEDRRLLAAVLLFRIEDWMIFVDQICVLVVVDTKSVGKRI